MSAKPKILLVDDDPLALSFLEYKLHSKISPMKCVSRTEPNVEGDFDIYFIDNDFQGRRIAADLAKTIRASNPNALIIAFSGTLDQPTLKKLINAGCSGACDKSQPTDLIDAIELTQQFIKSMQVQKEHTKQRGNRLMESIRSIRDLLDSWNTRLDQQDRLEQSNNGSPLSDPKQSS